MKNRGLAIVSGLLLSSNCFATSIVDRDISSILKGSKTVLEGKVIGIKAECDNVGCLSEVTIAVQKTYKGDEKSTEARFCSSAPLGIGFSYVFFVETAQSQVDKSKCGSVVERDAVFSRFGDAVYRYMSPGSFNTAKIDADEYLTGWILVKGFDANLPKR